MSDNEQNPIEGLEGTEIHCLAALGAFEENPGRLGYLGQLIGSQSPELRTWLISAGSWLREGAKGKQPALRRLTLDNYDNLQLAMAVWVLQSQVVAAQERKDAPAEFLMWKLLVHFTGVGFRRLLGLPGVGE